MSSKILLLSSLMLMLLSVEGLRAQSPTSPAKRFNIFISGNLRLGNSHEVEGPVAIGGDLTSGQYQIKFENAYNPFTVQGAPVSLAVRGGVKLNGGILRVLNDKYVKIGNCSPSTSGLNNLKVWLKDANNSPNIIKITDVNDNYASTQNSIELSARATTFTPNITNEVNPVCEQVFGSGDGQIDIDAAFIEMTQRSSQLAALTDNLPIYNIDSKTTIPGPILNPAVLDQNVKIIVDPTKLNVLTVSAAVWSSIRGTVIFENMPAGPSEPNVESSDFGVIINIINVPELETADGAKEVKFPNFGSLNDNHASYILYNFPDATTTLRLKGQVLFGAIFAPQTDLQKANSGNLNGQVIAKSFIHESDEIHYWPFITNIPEPAKSITVTATSKCLNDAPYLDYTVTPNNFDATGLTAKIEWINSAGTVVREDNGQPLSGSILFPGAALGTDGKGNAWPGWVLNGTKYDPVTDLNSTILNAGATIKVTVNPTQIISITYPEGAAGCSVSPPPATPLPVTLSSFTAKNENCKVQLKWSVTEAKNFSRFDIERSSDAKTFVSLSSVSYDAARKDYSATDSPFSNELTPAKYYYYRLKQVDLDETFEYSAIRSVDAGTCENRLLVSFYPNPTQDEINVKSGSPVKMLEIISIAGAQLYKISPSQGLSELKVDIQHLKQGLYIVNIINSEGKYSSKILKK